MHITFPTDVGGNRHWPATSSSSIQVNTSTQLEDEQRFGFPFSGDGTGLASLTTSIETQGWAFAHGIKRFFIPASTSCSCREGYRCLEHDPSGMREFRLSDDILEVKSLQHVLWRGVEPSSIKGVKPPTKGEQMGNFGWWRISLGWSVSNWTLL